MKGISGEKRSNLDKTETPQRSPLSPNVPGDFKTSSNPTGPPPLLHALPSRGLFRKAQQGLLQKPLSHAEQQFRRPSRPLTPAGPSPTPDPERLLGGGGEGGCGGQGVGGAAAATASLSFPVRRPRRDATAEGGRDGCERGPELESPRGRTPGIVSPTVRVRASPGHREPASGHDDRMPPPSLCFLRGQAAPLPRRRHPWAARASQARGAWPPTPTRGPARAAGRLPLAPYYSLFDRGSRARARRRRGGDRAEPSGRGEPETLEPPPRAGAAGGGGAAAAAGFSFVPAAAPSVAGTRRSPGSGGREAVGGAAEEEGAEGVVQKAAGAKAARGARPSSPHTSTGRGSG